LLVLEDGGTIMNAGDFLSEHHHHLERLFLALVVRAQQGDCAALQTEWSLFERELLRHLELEETEILPRFGQHHPREARKILAEHAQIRCQLEEMGVCLDLHLLRAQAVEDFVRRLSEHARREETLLYPEARRMLDRQRRERIRGELFHPAGEKTAPAPQGDGPPVVR
jgi:hemerythrin superfamily protein